MLRKTNRGSAHKHRLFERDSFWCGTTPPVGSARRHKGQACCDWQSDKLFDVELYFTASPPSACLFSTFLQLPIFILLQAIVTAFDILFLSLAPATFLQTKTNLLMPRSFDRILQKWRKKIFWSVLQRHGSGAQASVPLISLPASHLLK